MQLNAHFNVLTKQRTVWSQPVVILQFIVGEVQIQGEHTSLSTRNQVLCPLITTYLIIDFIIIIIYFHLYKIKLI